MEMDDLVPARWGSADVGGSRTEVRMVSSGGWPKNGARS